MDAQELYEAYLRYLKVAKRIGWLEDPTIVTKPECDCGTTKAIKDAPLRAHSHWCSYRKGQEGL